MKGRTAGQPQGRQVLPFGRTLEPESRGRLSLDDWKEEQCGGNVNTGVS
jgi:hypothetical protein